MVNVVLVAELEDSADDVNLIGTMGSDGYEDSDFKPEVSVYAEVPVSIE